MSTAKQQGNANCEGAASAALAELLTNNRIINTATTAAPKAILCPSLDDIMKMVTAPRMTMSMNKVDNADDAMDDKELIDDPALGWLLMGL